MSKFDNRLCKTDICRNNDICNKISNKTFECKCKKGWEGVYCEIKSNGIVMRQFI